MINITDKNNCTGCHACFSVCPVGCIKMKPDEKGFLYASAEKETCINCGKCEKICPVLNINEPQNNPKAYAVFNRNDEVRQNSSSGGVFSAAAEKIIGLDGCVFGAGFNKNFNVVHGIADQIDDIKKFNGAKYAQSVIGDSFNLAKQNLENDKWVLFSGTPCQIAGLKAFLGKDYDRLICQDVVCHGVPSPLALAKYLEHQSNKFGSPVSELNFRNKCTGWKNYSVSIKFKNKKEYCRESRNDVYMLAFIHNLSLRDSCYQCAFKSMHRQGDITLADFWGLPKQFAELDDDKGLSFVLVNNEKGQKFFDTLSGDLIFREVSPQAAVAGNPSAVESSKMNPNREKFFSGLKKRRFDLLALDCCGMLPPLKTRLKNKLSEYSAAIKHKLFHN